MLFDRLGFIFVKIIIREKMGEKSVSLQNVLIYINTLNDVDKT